MLGFIDFLVSKGFTAYRKHRNEYIECENTQYFSSTMPDYIDLRLKLGKKEVVYGLHERGHSPTLISPRPEGVIFDYQMDRLFQTRTFEQIYNTLWD